MGPLSSVYCICATSLFGSNMVWGVRVCLVLRRLGGLVHVLVWLVRLLVRCHVSDVNFVLGRI